MAAIPAYVRTWIQNLTTGVPGTRITYVSLLDCMQNYLYGVKAFLVAGGCSVVWSASNGTGPSSSSDHTDRITNAAAVTPRATIAGASQAWVVLLDGNGGQLLIAYTGASDDIAYLSYSTSASFTLAGTTNQRPTASDEMVISSAATLIGSATTADRVWHGLISNDAKAYRFSVWRSSVVAGQVWCVETFTPATFSGNVTLTKPVYAGSWTANNVTSQGLSFCGQYNPSNQGVQVRIVVSSVVYLSGCEFATWHGGNAQEFGVLTFAAELQSGYIPFPCVLYARNTNGARGAMGIPIDFWMASTGNAGDGFGGSYEWWQMGGYWLWPNPAAVAPTIN